MRLKLRRTAIWFCITFMTISMLQGDKLEYNRIKIESVAVLERFTLLCDTGGWVSLEIPEKENEIEVGFTNKAWVCERNGTGSWNLTPVKKGKDTLRIRWKKRLFLLKADSRDWGNNCSTLIFTEKLYRDRAETWGERLEALNQLTLKKNGGEKKKVESEAPQQEKELHKPGDSEYLFSLNGGYSSGGGESSFRIAGEVAAAFRLPKGLIVQGSGMVNTDKILKRYGFSAGGGFEPGSIGGFLFADMAITGVDGQDSTFAMQLRPGIRLNYPGVRGSLYGAIPLIRDQYTGKDVFLDGEVVKIYNRTLWHGGIDVDFRIAGDIWLGMDCKVAEAGVNSLTIKGEVPLSNNFGVNLRFSTTGYGDNPLLKGGGIKRINSFSLGLSHNTRSGEKGQKSKKLLYPRSYPVVVNIYKKNRENLPPLSIKLSASPVKGEAPLNVDLGAEVSGGKPPYNLTWEFSDCSGDDYKGAGHCRRVYSNAGDYFVRAEVTDSTGAKASSEKVKIEVTKTNRIFTINSSADSGGTVSPAGAIRISEGGCQVFTFEPDSGYSLADVVVDGISEGAIYSYSFDKVEKNHTIHGKFIKKSTVQKDYSINATAGDNGTISPAGVLKVSEGGKMEFTFQPYDGFRKKRVLVDGTEVNCGTYYSFTNIRASHSIHVEFEAVPVQLYTITSSAGANGTITPEGTKEYKKGENGEYTITPDKGYHIERVLVDGANAGLTECIGSVISMQIIVSELSLQRLHQKHLL